MKIGVTQKMAIAVRYELKHSFMPGDKFYGYRECAQRYGVGEKTAFTVLQIMVSEGLLESRHRSGYYVK